MLKQRVITGLILIIAFAGLLLSLPAMAFVAVIGVVILLGAWEWSRLAGLESLPKQLLYVGVMAAAMAAYHWGALGPPIAVLVVAAGWWLLVLFWVLDYPDSARQWDNRPVALSMGLMVLLPAWIALYWLLGRSHGAGWLALVVGVVASADIGAFVGGRALGRHRLAPAVSPGKTWEGVLCGLLLALLVGAAAARWLGVAGQDWFWWLALMVATSFAGVLGDLGESMIKRARGVKDSGTVLPGHGGVLDRVDSLAAALPVFVLGMMALGFARAAPG
ncbi:MAG: phosphatidate cytidylyltransferase [Porticoccaceae bacterium]